MKKWTLWAMALLLLLVGCRTEAHPENISVPDALCPYQAQHRDGTLELTTENGPLEEVTWEASLLPGELCAITRQTEQTQNLWTVTGIQEGLTQLTLQAADETGKPRFQLVVMLEVDAQGAVTARWAEHRQHRSGSGTTGELPWTWEVGLEGILSFKLRDREDQSWQLTVEPNSALEVSELRLMPSGCGFEVRPLAPGAGTLIMENPDRDRTLTLRFQVDEALTLQLLSVEE